MSKKPGKKKPVVRGPQKELPLPRAKGEPSRTARIRYMEPPTKKDGNPFFALRVPAELLRAFKRYAKEKKTEPTVLVRAYMSKVTGVDTEGDSDA